MFRLVLSAFLATVAIAAEPKYSECVANSIVYVNHVSTVPYPPSLSTGFTAKYDLGIREGGVIDGHDVDVILTIKVKLGMIWITVPCVDQIGSCHYQDVCQLMQDNAREHICEKLGLPCRCPMPKTDIHGEYKVDPITDIPDNIKGLLNSQVVAHGEIIKGGNIIGCLDVEADIRE